MHQCRKEWQMIVATVQPKEMRAKHVEVCEYAIAFAHYLPSWIFKLPFAVATC